MPQGEETCGAIETVFPGSRCEGGDRSSDMNRRQFLSSTGLVLASRSLPGVLRAQAGSSAASRPGEPDYKLRIEPCTLEIGPGVTIKTLGYNGQVPGPVLRLREGKQ